MIGQLERLAELKKQHSAGKSSGAKVISVISGKGGTGKSSFCINLGYHLSKTNLKILVIDLDLNFANVGLMLNIYAEKTLADFFNGRALFDEIIYSYSDSLHFIFGDSGEKIMKIDEAGNIDSMFTKLEAFRDKYDYIILDHSSGINNRILGASKRSDLSLIVATTEPTSVMDAYVSIKYLISEKAVNDYGVVINKSKTTQDGINAFKNIKEATRKFLHTGTKLYGILSYDTLFINYVGQQKLYLKETKNEAYKTQMAEIAKNVIEIGQMANNVQLK